jgi:hypothetical protein
VIVGEFERRLSPVMRQHHVAGDKVFVDYSGKKIAIVNPATGVVREVEIFVALLGASNYTYAEASWTQTLPNWIEAHDSTSLAACRSPIRGAGWTCGQSVDAVEWPAYFRWTSMSLKERRSMTLDCSLRLGRKRSPLSMCS